MVGARGAQGSPTACVPLEFGAVELHGHGLHCARALAGYQLLLGAAEEDGHGLHSASVGIAADGQPPPAACVPLEFGAAEEHGQGLHVARVSTFWSSYPCLSYQSIE